MDIYTKPIHAKIWCFWTAHFRPDMKFLHSAFSCEVRHYKLEIRCICTDKTMCRLISAVDHNCNFYSLTCDQWNDLVFLQYFRSFFHTGYSGGDYRKLVSLKLYYTEHLSRYQLSPAMVSSNNVRVESVGKNYIYS